MIPSSPLRTWIFLLVSTVAFYGPGLLVPTAWDKNTSYFLLLSNLYQGTLVVAGFWYGPAICRALAEKMVVAGPLRQTLDLALAALYRDKEHIQLAKIPASLFEHSTHFIVTVGLFPRQSQVFLSSDLVERLGENGLRFLLARALVHGNWTQRLAAFLPILVMTVMLPGTPTDALAWLDFTAFLIIWLFLHWFFELRADYQAAQAVGKAGAEEGLRELLLAFNKPFGFSMHPPTRWRLYVVARS